jgi:hypothetical protein
MMKEKVILTDCDGVVLDWQHSWRGWMHRQGYKIVDDSVYDVADQYGLERPYAKRLVRLFNESAWIRKIPPLRDSMKYIKKLHEEHGYVFHAITSLSNDQYAQYLRCKNLGELFGKTAFERYVYLDTGADKDEILKEYEGTGCYWIEDKIENATVGKNLGLNSHLIAHDFNTGDHGIPRVKNWKELYEIITG